jgi:hypothetical protein
VVATWGEVPGTIRRNAGTLARRVVSIGVPLALALVLLGIGVNLVHRQELKYKAIERSNALLESYNTKLTGYIDRMAEYHREALDATRDATERQERIRGQQFKAQDAKVAETVRREVQAIADTHLEATKTEMGSIKGNQDAIKTALDRLDGRLAELIRQDAVRRGTQ